MLGETKKLWEELRRKDLKMEARRDCCSALLALCRGKMMEIMCKHDGSRVIQSLVKHGDANQRGEIMSELSGKMVALAKSPYAKHLVVTLLRYGNAEMREKILREFHGSVRRLVRHRDAAPVLEFAYTTVANAQQRRALLAEFYGPQYTLFHAGRPLDELFKEKPDIKNPILRDLGVVVRAVIDKGLLAHSIVHRILLDYLTYLAPSEIKDMVRALRDQVVHILHTKEGAQIGTWCVTYGTPKDRKAIIKSFKSFVVKIALEDYGHIALLRLIDVTDDTVLVRKALYSELMSMDDNNLLQILSSKTGRLSFLQLLTPCSSRYFSKDTIKQFQPSTFPTTDPTTPATPISKKDPDVRRKELLQELVPQFMEVLVPAQRTCPGLLHSLIASQFGNAFVLELALYVTGDNKERLHKAIAQEAAGERNDLLNDFVACRFYKRLVKLAPGFGLLLLPEIEKRVVHWAKQNNSIHVIEALLRNPSVSLSARSLLVPHQHELPTHLQPLLS